MFDKLEKKQCRSKTGASVVLLTGLALGLGLFVALVLRLRSEPSVLFDGRRWQLVGETTWMPYSKRFDGREYRAIDDDYSRFLDCTSNDGERLKLSQTYLPNGRWVNHGREERHFADGTVYVSQYLMGTESGLFEAFYSNGKKHIERSVAHGEWNGIETGWNEDGSLQYQVRNENGKEVEVLYDYFQVEVSNRKR